jgi:hypothetical protein
MLGNEAEGSGSVLMKILFGDIPGGTKGKG